MDLPSLQHSVLCAVKCAYYSNVIVQDVCTYTLSTYTLYIIHILGTLIYPVARIIQTPNFQG